MALTFNQVIKRLLTICLAHRQIRTAKKIPLVGDFFADKTTKYPAAIFQDQGGTISTSQRAAIIKMRLFLVDLVNVTKDEKSNELDVQSDMISIAMDIISQINAPSWGDWTLDTDSDMQMVFENDNDLSAGVYVDITIRTMFKQNLCEIPSDLFDMAGEPETEAIGGLSKTVDDVAYIATGTERMEITVPEIAGKKILFVTREGHPIYKVSNDPDSTEYTWNDTIISVGTDIQANERFLILYRNY